MISIRTLDLLDFSMLSKFYGIQLEINESPFTAVSIWLATGFFIISDFQSGGIIRF